MLDGCCQLYTPPHHVRPKTSSLRVKFVIVGRNYFYKLISLFGYFYNLFTHTF